MNNPGNHLRYKRKNPDPPFRIRTNSDLHVAIALISLFFTTGFSGPNRISHPDKSGYPRGDCPDCVRISHPNFPEKSGFRIRTNSDIPEEIVRISPHFTSEYQGSISQGRIAFQFDSTCMSALLARSGRTPQPIFFSPIARL